MYIYIYIYVYMHVYTYMYVYTHTHIYISYTRTLLHFQFPPNPLFPLRGRDRWRGSEEGRGRWERIKGGIDRMRRRGRTCSDGR
jgi:hypothetical protein